MELSIPIVRSKYDEESAHIYQKPLGLVLARQAADTADNLHIAHVMKVKALKV